MASSANLLWLESDDGDSGVAVGGSGDALEECTGRRRKARNEEKEMEKKKLVVAM